MEATIINLFKEPMDISEYAYLNCKCTILPDAVRIKRPKEGGYIRVTCPRCNTSLGIILRNKN